MNLNILETLGAISIVSRLADKNNQIDADILYHATSILEISDARSLYKNQDGNPRQTDIRTLALADAIMDAGGGEEEVLPVLAVAAGANLGKTMNHFRQHKRKEDLRERLRKKVQAKKQ